MENSFYQNLNRNRYVSEKCNFLIDEFKESTYWVFDESIQEKKLNGFKPEREGVESTMKIDEN